MVSGDRDSGLKRSLSLSQDQFNLLLVITHKHYERIKADIGRLESLLKGRGSISHYKRQLEHAYHQRTRTKNLIQTLWEARLYDSSQNTNQSRYPSG